MNKKFDDFLPLRYPGPITTARQARMKAIYLCVAALGMVLALIPSSSGLQAFGLGLLFPGAGFLQYLSGGWLMVVAHLFLFVFSGVLFVLGLIAWFWTANVLAPLAVWFLAALGAGLMNHHHSFSGAPAVVVILVIVLAIIAKDRNAKHLRERQENLAKRKAAITQFDTPESPVDIDTGMPEVKELSREDLEALRFAYDRALQPIDEWNGFHMGQQWQGESTRYQVNMLSWALSLANYNALPAMRTYLQDAQLNLIEKTKSHKMWSYWQWESLFGLLRWNPDPMPNANIMYSGYTAMQIGLYQAATGDLRHDDEDSFVLKNPNGESYIYDFPKIVGIVNSQFEESDFCYFSCEPNFLFTYCNAFGAIALKSYDATHGTDRFEKIEPRYREKHKSEFMHIDGNVMFGKSAHTGLPLNIGPNGSLLFQSIFMSPLLPDVSSFQWEIAKSEFVRKTEHGLELVSREKLISPDPATLKKSEAYTLALFTLAAAEQGDTEAFEFGNKMINEYCPPVLDGGVRYIPGVSIMVYARFIMARVVRTKGLHDLVTKGSDPKWLSGPILTKANYPMVQVAKAVSDGVNLELVLYPENEADTQEIEISQLQPNRNYAIKKVIDGDVDQTVLTDENGQITIAVELNDRTELHIIKI
jgi:hypothetical protein